MGCITKSKIDHTQPTIKKNDLSIAKLSIHAGEIFNIADPKITVFLTDKSNKYAQLTVPQKICRQACLAMKNLKCTISGKYEAQ